MGSGEAGIFSAWGVAPHLDIPCRSHMCRATLAMSERVEAQLWMTCLFATTQPKAGERKLPRENSGLDSSSLEGLQLATIGSMGVRQCNGNGVAVEHGVGKSSECAKRGQESLQSARSCMARWMAAAMKSFTIRLAQMSLKLNQLIGGRD